VCCGGGGCAFTLNIFRHFSFGEESLEASHMYGFRLHLSPHGHVRSSPCNHTADTDSRLLRPLHGAKKLPNADADNRGGRSLLLEDKRVRRGRGTVAVGALAIIAIFMIAVTCFATLIAEYNRYVYSVKATSEKLLMRGKEKLAVEQISNKKIRI